MIKRLQQFIVSLVGKGQGAELARGSALLLVAKVFGAASGYVMAFLLTQRGSPAAVGVYEQALTVIILLNVFARFGLDGAIVRFIGIFNGKNKPGAVRWLYQKSMIFSASFAVLLGVVVYFLAPVLAHLFNDDHLEQPFKFAAIAVPFFTLMNMNGETLRGFKQMISYSFLQAGTVVFVSAGIFFFWADGDDVGLKGIQSFLLASILLFIISQFIVAKRFKRIPLLEAPKTTFNDVLKIAWPIFLSSSIFMVMSWTDTLMIGYFLDSEDVGIYRVAFRISTVITFTQFAINGIAAPMIANHYHQGDLPGLRKLVHKIGLFNFMLSMPIFLLIALAPMFMLGLFGAEYEVGKSILLTLSFGQVAFALSGPVMYILTMTKHEKTALHIMYITAGINLVGNAMLIPLYGLQGAAIATTTTTILWNVLAIFAVYKYMGIVSVPFIHRLFKNKQ